MATDSQTVSSLQNRQDSTIRLQILWRLAYVFLRLDQLPSGGWGKTLYSWMNKIWEGDKGAIVRTPDTRFEGGVDYTTYALRNYYEFLRRTLGANGTALLLQNNDTDIRAYRNFEKRINFNGMIGVYQVRTSGEPEVRLRHTLLGFITFLQHRTMHGNNVSIEAEIDRLYEYIISSMSKWEQDKSHHYALAGAAVKLVEMLEQTINLPLDIGKIEDLRAALKAEIPNMMRLLTRLLEYHPQPARTILGPLHGAGFRPYGDFWRMERSCFLMHLPLFIREDRQAFCDGVTPEFQSRCVQTFQPLLDEIGTYFNADKPHEHLLHYHRNPSRTLQAPRDWGLSAELVALLHTPAVHNLLLQQHQIMSDEAYEIKCEILIQALLATFDHYHQNPSLFEFTQSPAFSRILQVIEPSQVDPAELRNLDMAVCNLLEEGVTEWNLGELVRDSVLAPAGSDAGIKKRAIQDFLVTKLESGEHTPDGAICDKARWARRVEGALGSTIDFYEGSASDEHITRYADMPRKNLIDEINFLFEQRASSNGAAKTALDVGCGVGQYAQILSQQGYEVSLLDASQRMLTLAAQRADIPAERMKNASIFDRGFGYGNKYPHYFDLIFACAVMIHVPEEKREQIYATFHQFLKPDGILFVNYKLGDHSLISDNGRYFAYYRDDSWIQQELEQNGFQVRVKIEDMNYRDMYGTPKQIRWAHYCCTREMG